MSQAPMGSVRSATLRNVASLAAGRLSAIALQFVAFTIMVATLGPSDTGVYTLALAFVLLFQFGTELGLQGVVLRDVVQHPERESTLVSNLLYLRLLLGLAAFGVVAGLVTVVPFSSDVEAAAVVMSITFLVIGFEAFGVPLEARLRMGVIAAAFGLQAVAALIGTLVLAALEAGVLEFVWLYVGTNALRSAIVTVAGLRAARGLDWRPRPRAWTPVLRVALPVAVAILLTTGYARLDMLLLGALASAEEVGQYGIAYRFFDTLIIFAGVAQSAVAPVLARSWADSAMALRRRLQRSVSASLAVALPVSIAGVMTAWRVVPAIPGLGEFSGGARALSILCVAYVVVFLGHQFHSVLVVGHQQARLLSIAAAGLVVNVALTVPLILVLSYEGAAIATVLTELVVFALFLVAMRRRMGVRLTLDGSGRIAVSCGAMALVLAVGYLAPAAVQLAAAAAAYLVVATKLGVINWADFGALISARGGGARLDGDGSGGLHP
jgi:O-antigen/teichoic acid export membrane protein